MSAIYVGPAVVIVGSTLASRALGRGLAPDILSSLAKVIPYLLGVYLFAKILELLIAGDFQHLFDGDRASALFSVEMSVGIIFPMLMLLSAAIRQNVGWRFLASLMIIAGLMLNRVDVSIISWARPEDALTYTVHPLEWAFTIGLWAGLALVFYLVALYFPVFGDRSGHGDASD